MFRFNFHGDAVDVDDIQVDHQQQESSQESCREIVVSDVPREYIFKSTIIDNAEFFIRDLENETEEMNREFMTSYKNCDVIPSIYEGGLKVWECTFDLLSFLNSKDVSFENKTVLDLGCGCGLLGIFAGMRGAKVVHFQDFNVEVLRDFTIPNVRRNNLKSVAKFFSGDWRHFLNSLYLEGIEYDYILTSETLYNTNNYSKLCDLFVGKLRNHGEIFVASKSFYFGVGGSVQQFQKYLLRNKSLQTETVWKSGEGVQREILCIKKDLGVLK